MLVAWVEPGDEERTKDARVALENTLVEEEFQVEDVMGERFVANRHGF